MQNEDCRNKIRLAGTGPGRAIWHSSFVILFAVLTTFFAASSFGQSSNRWLFIFDVSTSMHGRAKGVQEATRDLLSTGMHGQIRQGDTIGIWTFDDQLHAGEVPLQTWSPASRSTIVQHTLQFLGKQDYMYVKSGHVNAAIPAIVRVVQSSDIITVFLFSDGYDRINGTPIDDSLNAFYKDSYRKQKKAHMPFITVFRGEHGYITTNTMNLAPWPVDIPPVPLRQVVREIPPIEAPKPKPAPPVVPSLILIGKKPETAAPAEPFAPRLITASNMPTLMPPRNLPAISTNAEAEPAPAPAPKADAAIQAGETRSVKPELAAMPPPAPVTETPPVKVPAQSQSVSNSAEPAVAPPAPPPAVATAAAVSPKNIFSARNIGIFSVALAVVVCGFFIISGRRSRERVSLITRSLDREK
jgi:hypothetical protein